MRTVRHNQTGKDILFLKALLFQAQLPTSEGDKFDDVTLAAVKSFQKKNNLESDGIAGKDTWKKLLDVAPHMFENVR